MSVHLAHLQQLPHALHTQHFPLNSEDATVICAQRFSKTVLKNYFSQSQRSPAQIQLSGPLGAGKTIFARAFIRDLGYTGRVKSPTYTLVEPYTIELEKQTLHLYHFDLYRLNDPREWFDAGLEDYFQDKALCLIEWPEKAIGALPLPDLLFQFKLETTHHTVDCYAFTELGKICLETY